MKIQLASIFALVLAMTACNSNTTTEPEKEVIILKAGVDATTKAPIDSLFSTDFPIGVYARGSAWLAGTSANWINNDAATVAGAAGHAVTFGSGPYYYPSNGSTLFFYAFSPRATETTAAGAGTSPVVTHTITGQEDILWASSTGFKIGSDPASPPVMNFQHKLSQLQFTFKSSTTYPATGNKVVSLLVKTQPTSVIMNVESGACTFSGSGSMQILSTANQTAGIDITTAGTNALSPIITRAQTGTTAYTIDVVVKPVTGSNVTYSNIPINVTAVNGSAHMVTLTFTLTGVTASATVANWVTGTGGSATAQ